MANEVNLWDGQIEIKIKLGIWRLKNEYLMVVPGLQLWIMTLNRKRLFRVTVGSIQWGRLCQHSFWGTVIRCHCGHMRSMGGSGWTCRQSLCMHKDCRHVLACPLAWLAWPTNRLLPQWLQWTHVLYILATPGRDSQLVMHPCLLHWSTSVTN